MANHQELIQKRHETRITSRIILGRQSRSRRGRCRRKPQPRSQSKSNAQAHPGHDDDLMPENRPEQDCPYTRDEQQFLMLVASRSRPNQRIKQVYTKTRRKEERKDIRTRRKKQNRKKRKRNKSISIYPSQKREKKSNSSKTSQSLYVQF